MLIVSEDISKQTYRGKWCGKAVNRYIIVRECAEGKIHIVVLFINESVISAYKFKYLMQERKFLPSLVEK